MRGSKIGQLLQRFASETTERNYMKKYGALCMLYLGLKILPIPILVLIKLIIVDYHIYYRFLRFVLIVSILMGVVGSDAYFWHPETVTTNMNLH